MDLFKAKYSDKKFTRNSKSNKTRFNKNSKDDEPSSSFRNSRKSDSRFDRNREMYAVICAECKMECKIPFEPKFNKPVYCSKCFEKNEPQKSKNSRYSRDDKPRDRYSRDDKPRDRYSRDDNRNQKSFNNYIKPQKSKSEKFQKKQESFYSNGSEKFYASLKEKLFTILGGKVCSSCGFRDERALGFTHIYDADAFDSIRRGGFASSWGKYISEPELAKQELRVLCLNCNEIREPQRKTESEKPRKKSRYFPR
jgi:CxxC-x17-CxxC domain-containing protein